MATITRANWSAGPHRAGVIATPVSRLYLHHAVTAFWTGAQAARNLQRIARSRGFVDISYSWLTDRQGNEIEGRGWGRQGAHTKGWNGTSHAVSLVGNLEDHPMPAGMIRGAVRLIRRHRAYGPGRITHPHSAVSSTACPGRHARPRISEINAAAAGSTSPPPPPTGDWFDMANASDLRRIVREELDHAKTARHIKTYGRDWMHANLAGIIRPIFREELDHAKTARPAKTYGRDYIKEAVEPELAAIKAAVTSDNDG